MKMRTIKGWKQVMFTPDAIGLCAVDKDNGRFMLMTDECGQGLELDDIEAYQGVVVGLYSSKKDWEDPCGCGCMGIETFESIAEAIAFYEHDILESGV